MTHGILGVKAHDIQSDNQGLAPPQYLSVLN